MRLHYSGMRRRILFRQL